MTPNPMIPASDDPVDVLRAAAERWRMMARPSERPMPNEDFDAYGLSDEEWHEYVDAWDEDEHRASERRSAVFAVACDAGADAIERERAGA